MFYEQHVAGLPQQSWRSHGPVGGRLCAYNLPGARLLRARRFSVLLQEEAGRKRRDFTGDIQLGDNKNGWRLDWA